MKKKLLSLFLALTLACSLAVPALAEGDKYAGIEAGAWYETAAKYAVDNGVMTGTDKGFEPQSTVTRGQIYQIIYNLAGKPAEGVEKAAFNDLEGKWYADAAHWAGFVGIASGKADGAFGGDEAVTRAEVAQVIMNYAQLSGITADAGGMALKEAPDYGQIPTEYLDGVSFCYYAKVMVGDDKGNLNPTASLTRAQLAQVMQNFAALTPTFTEEAVTISVPEQDGIPAHEIPGILTLPEKADKAPGVVMLHGTGSEKNEAGGGYATAAPLLASAGIATLRIDFMGNGDSKADYVNYNYTSAKIDAKAAADYLAKVDGVDGAKLGVMGWSQGGTDALLAAAAYPDTFKAVVTWAGALDLSTMFKDFKAAKAEAEKNGSFEMTFDWREPLRVGAQWFKEVAATDMLKEVAKIKAPVLAINGDKDDVVPMDNAVAIKKAAQDGAAWIVDGADHTYNVFSGNLSALYDAVAATAYFFEAKLDGALAGSVYSVSKYGNITTSIPQDAFALAGFVPGDILTVTVNGKSVDMPYGDTYSNVDTGKEILVPDKDTGLMTAAVNMGSFANTYGAEVGTLVTVALKEKAGYLEEYEIRNIDAKRTNERKDYASDEVFANFRPVESGKIAKGLLYRSSSPVNPELGRNAYADALAKKAGIATFINLADDEETMKGYEGFDKSYYATAGIVNLNMGVDFKAEDFTAKLKTGLEFMLDSANKGPYLIHCNEGKDRAGFVVTVLEALMGATEEEMKDDYMISFENYYHVEKGSDQWNRIAESNVMANLKFLASVMDGAKGAPDYAKAAAAYLTGDVGLTAEQVTALQTLLSTPVAGDKAA